MAVTVHPYNHTARKLLDGDVDFTALKVMLLNDTAVGAFDASHTSIDDVAGEASPSRANEVHGNGWDEGGELIANVAVTTTNTNDAMIDADDLIVTASGGAIGPAYGAVIYDSDSDAPLWLIDFGEDLSAGDTTNFRFTWNPAGLVTATVP